jgi:hypothetical protein
MVSSTMIGKDAMKNKEKKLTNSSNTTYLVVVFFKSSNMNRGERQPVASQGEILHEKLAP